MIEDRILDKIKKCLALSESPEPAEAAAALRQAQKLMEKYGVSQLDLSASDVGEATVKTKVSVSRVNQWELRVMHLVAKAFGCQILWTAGYMYNRGHYTLIGLKTQLPLAQYTCQVLQRKLINARGKYLRELPEWYSRKRKTMEADGFCNGWIASVSSKVHEFACSDETRELIKHKTNQLSSGDTCNVRKRQLGAEGYAAGTVAGSDEYLHRPMEQTKQERIR